MAQMTVQIVTPDGIRYDHHATFLVAKTKTGEMGVYPGHSDMMGVLEIDEIKIVRPDDDTHVDWVAVNGGIIEINNNRITVISDSAERSRDIDIPRAERAKYRAEKELEAAKETHNIDEERRAEVALQRALNRIRVGNR